MPQENPGEMEWDSSVKKMIAPRDGSRGVKVLRDSLKVVNQNLWNSCRSGYIWMNFSCRLNSDLKTIPRNIYRVENRERIEKGRGYKRRGNG